MTREDLAKLCTAELIDIILMQQEQIVALLASIAALKDELARVKPPKDKPVPDWVKPSKPKLKPKPSAKKGHQGFGRKREEPTKCVRHAAKSCPDCGCELRGGWVKRRRQVLHIPVAPVEVIEHEIVARRCPRCHKVVVPKVDLSAQVVGKHRVSLDTMSLIATLSEVGRLPLEVLQKFLSWLYHLKLSLGELVVILKAVAKRGKAMVEGLKQEIRGSPVVHADETGLRQNGQNGYIWTFSMPGVRYFVYRLSRGGEVVSEVLGENFGGCLVTDFYAAYNRMLGRHQRCWAHLLRDVHKLREAYPDDAKLQGWGSLVHRLYRRAKAFSSQDEKVRTRAQRHFEKLLTRICQPFVRSDSPQHTLCERIERYLPELFAFVGDPRVPSDNNAAERSLRPLVVDRKISGGTRSAEGSATKMTLASLFGTWLVRGHNPYQECRKLLTSPQV